jgi:pimeloyl-ACP methyl ester carboxylesterase
LSPSTDARRLAATAAAFAEAFWGTVMLTWSRRLAIALALLSLAVLPVAGASANSDLGVVVLHGKQGGPGGRPTASFLQALRSAGYTVQAPEMCWSGNRIYDAPYLDCLKAIDTAVAALRAAGARRIVIAGHSLGGNAAIVYGTQHPELTGVVALAPAALPQQFVRNPRIAAAVAQARQMVAAGQGSQRVSFIDGNNGQTFTVVTTPAIYLSFIEPGGPADFAAALPQLRVPIIWVSGSSDPTQEQAASQFPRLPANPLNKFVQVSATHLDTPNAAIGAVLEWLKALPPR